MTNKRETTHEIAKATQIISDLLASTMQKMDRAPYAWECDAISFLRRHTNLPMNMWTHDKLVQVKP